MAARSLGVLTLDMVLKSGNFETSMEKTARTTKEKSASISSDLTKVGLGVAAAGAAAATAAVVWTKGMAQMGADVSKLAELSGVSAERFQELAYGAKSVGIEQDKLGDIFKDVQDKVGDFMQTGAGPLADFFEKIGPKVGVTAKQFKGLSGPDALGLYVSSLEKAGVSQAEMTFYLEAIASDATVLLPLLKNNSQGFKELGAEAQKYGAILNDDAIKAGKDLQRNLQQLDAMWDSVSVTLANKVLPVLSTFAGSTIKAWQETDDFKRATDSLTGNDAVPDWLEAVTLGLGVLADIAATAGRAFVSMAKGFQVTVSTMKAGKAFLGVLNEPSNSDFWNPETEAGKGTLWERINKPGSLSAMFSSSAGETEAQKKLQGTLSELSGNYKLFLDAVVDIANVPAVTNYDRAAAAVKSIRDKANFDANFVGPPVPTNGAGNRGTGIGTGTKPVNSTSTDAFIAGIKAQIAEQDALTKSLQVYGLEAAKVNAGDKLMLQLQQQLGLAQADRSGKVTDATLKEAMGLAAVLSARTRDNEQMQKSLEMAAAFTEYRKSMSQAEIELGDTLADTVAGWNKTAEATQIAAAQSKIYREAEKQIDAVLKAGLPGALAQVKAIEDAAEAHAQVTASLMGRIQAEQGAQQLLAENRKFAAESILDETQRAAAILQIDVDNWRERIRIAGEGSAEQKKLQEQFDVWLRNQTMLPVLEAQRRARQQTIDDWMETIDGVGEVFRQGFADMLNGGENAWKSFTKSLSTTFKTIVADSIYKMLAKPFIVQLVAGVAGLATGDTKIADQIVKQSGATGDSLFGGTSVLSKLFSPSNSSYNPVADNVAGMSATGNAVYGAITDWAWNNIGSSSEMMSNVAGAVMENSEAIAAFADTAGSVLAYGGAIMSALNGDFGAAIGGAIGAYFGGPIGSFIGSKIGGLLDGEKTQPGVGTYGIAEIGKNGAISGAVQDESFFYGDRRGYKGMSGSLVSATANLGAQITQLARLYGGDASGLRVGMQSAFSPDGKGANVGTVLSRDGTAVFGTAIEGANDALEANAALVIERSLLGGLRESKLEEGFAEVLNGVNISEATQEVVDGLKEQLQAVKDIKDSFVGLGQTLPYLSELGWSAQNMLVQLSGGLEQFKTNVSSYYQAFHSEDERAADSLSQMTKQLAMLGLAVPKTREEYRKLLESQNTATLGGQLVTATLFEMAGQFDQWATYADAQQASVTALNESFAKLGDSMSTLSAETRKALVDLSGGLDQFQTKVSAYYQAYYSDGEKAASTLDTVRGAFTELGMAMPTTRAEFRALVESLDLTTGSGRKAYATLIGVSEGFGTVADRLQSIVDASRQQAQQNANNAMTILSNAIQTRRDEIQTAFDLVAKSLQTGIDAAQNSVTKLTALSSSLKSSLEGLAQQFDPVQNRRNAQEQISRSLSVAQLTGVLPDASALENSLSVIAQPSEGLFATFEEYQTDFLKTANDIAALNKLTQGQLTTEEKTLAALQQSLRDAQDRYDDQMLALDEQLELAQRQLEEAMGTRLAVMSVEDAMTNLSANIAVLAAAQKNVPATAGGGGGVLGGLSATEQAVYDAYKSSGLGYLDAEGFKFWTDAINNGANVGAIVDQIKDINGAKNALIDGSHATGLNWVPWDSYIAELHAGEMVLPADDARVYRALQNAPDMSAAGMQVANRLDLIRQELIGMRSETLSTAQSSARLLRLLERWDGDGLPSEREDLAA